MMMQSPQFKLTKGRILGGGLLVALLLGITAFSLRPPTKQQSKILRVERKNLVQSLQLSGKVFPEQTMVITAQQSGRIVALNVKEGAKVASGDLLFTMKLEAEGQTELMDLRARVRSLEHEVAAATRLMKDKSKVAELVGVAQVVKEESELERRRIDLAASRQRLAVVEANLGLAQGQKTGGSDGIVYVRSPISGIVTLVDKRPGDFVLGGAGATAGEIGGTNERMVMVVADMNKLQVRTRVMEADLRYVQRGLPVKVRLDAYSDVAFDGRVEQIGGQGRLESRAGYTYFDVYVGLDQRDERLLPEMNATVDLIFASREAALTLPTAGVLILPDRSFVRIADSSPQGYSFQEVKTGVANASDVEIVSGLKEGAEVLEIDFASPQIFELAGQQPKGNKADTL